MAEVFGSAVLQLGVDDKGLSTGLDKVAKTSEARMKDIGKKMTVRVTAPILAIGAAVFKATEEIDEAMATIQTGTGATGEALQGLQTDFEAVYGSVPGNAQTAATAIADLNTTLGLTGEPLQEAARQSIELADALGIDVGTAIENTAQAMAVFEIPASEVSTVMDKMFVVSQETGVGFDTLSGQVQEFGPVLKNAGFSMDETVALFGQLHEGGIDVTRIMPGLNQAIRKIAEEAAPDFSEAIDENRETVEASTLALEDNIEAQQSLAENLKDVATSAIEDHSSAVSENADSIQKAQQDLKIFNARMKEQGGEVKESTRLANEFKKAELNETLSDLRVEQDDLTESGKNLKAAVEDTTDVQVDLQDSSEETRRRIRRRDRHAQGRPEGNGGAGTGRGNSGRRDRIPLRRRRDTHAAAEGLQRSVSRYTRSAGEANRTDQERDDRHGGARASYRDFRRRGRSADGSRGQGWLVRT